MTKQKATELLEVIRQLKDLKGKLKGWDNPSGYYFDDQIETYLQGIVESTDA